jgi:thioredoxin reductase
MSQVPAHSLAIIGAGPVGLEAAAAALELGFDVHIFERSDVGAHAIAWGHVRMFTPWSMNLGPASVRLLQKHGWNAPAPDDLPTGLELAERLLQPLAATPELKDRIHTHSQVVHVSRRGQLKADHIGAPERRSTPFRLLVRDAGGRENFLHAYAVIDASGTYGSPNFAGSGGIPARSELYLAPQLSYHVDDVLGLRRERYAGKRTLVLGGGASAVTSVIALAQLAREVPGTTVLWVTRSNAPHLAGDTSTDSLPARAALTAQARALQGGSEDSITWAGGGVIDGFEYNSGTHRYRVQLAIGEQARIEEVDQVIVNAGFGPDNAIYRELQIHECYGSRGPMNLSAALLGAGTSDCTAVPAFGVAQLKNPEPDFYILGAKSYARYNSFLLKTGYAQVATVMEQLVADRLSTAGA